MKLTRNALRWRSINPTILHYGKGVCTPPQQYVRLAERIKIATVLATLVAYRCGAGHRVIKYPVGFIRLAVQYYPGA